MNTKNKKIILIVEDEIALLDGLGDKFLRRGFKILKAKDGEEGLNFALKKHPDFILLDLSMPNIDGVSMLTELRKDDWGKKAKVVVWTNSKNNIDIAYSKKMGALDLWVKSDYDFKQIVDNTSKILGVE